MKIAFIVKGTSGRKQYFYQALARYEDEDVLAQTQVFETEYAGHAPQLAAQHGSEVDLLVAVGGDGTLNEIVNACLAARTHDPDFSLPAFAALAYGTANDFIKSCKSDGSFEQFLQLLRQQSLRVIDAGKVSCVAEDGGTVTRYFVNAADVGVGATVVQRLAGRRRYLGASLSYLMAIVSAFLGYRRVELSVVTDTGLQWCGPVLALVASSGRFFGSGLKIAPNAELDDGKLDVLLVGDVSLRAFFSKLVDLRSGNIIEHPEVSYHQVGRIEVAGIAEQCALEVDGEYIGKTPAVIKILPASITFMMPCPDSDTSE
ncbi:MAG: diacylglycerol kinase family protein [Halioglobus sp.]